MIAPNSQFAWFLAMRPRTLPLSAIPVFIGTLLAYRDMQTVDWGLSFFALLVALSMQIGTNLINDALDFQKGADAHDRVGPVRATQSGLLAMRHVFAAGVFTFMLGAVCGIPLILKGGVSIAILLVCSIIAGYLYTGGPYPLAYRGLGELFVLIFFGFGSTLAVYYVQTGHLIPEAYLRGLQLGLLACAPIAINNLRDHVQDAKVKKNTLAVMCGPFFARCEISAFLLIPFLINPWWPPLMIMPFAIKLIYDIWTTRPGKIYNQFLAWSVGIDMLFTALLGYEILA